MTKLIQIEVGILLCGPIRDYLETCKFSGLNIEYLESSGLLSREFTIKGQDEHIDHISDRLEEWCEEEENERKRD